jgi:hypothetical protein
LKEKGEKNFALGVNEIFAAKGADGDAGMGTVRGATSSHPNCQNRTSEHEAQA